MSRTRTMDSLVGLAVRFTTSRNGLHGTRLGVVRLVTERYVDVQLRNDRGVLGAMSALSERFRGTRARLFHEEIKAVEWRGRFIPIADWLEGPK